MIIWEFNSQRFIKVETSSARVTHLMVALNLSYSVSEATRLVKGNAVSWRDYWGSYTKIQDPFWECPKGTPYYLGVGNRFGRLLANVPGNEGKFKWCKGACCFMIPDYCTNEKGELTNELQDIDFWSELWRQK
jgi:hypothetical protein